MLEHSSSLTCDLSILPWLIPYSSDVALAFNSVIKRLIVFGHHPCPAVFSLFLYITQRDAQQDVSFASILKPAGFYTLFWWNPLWPKEKERISCTERELEFADSPAWHVTHVAQSWKNGELRNQNFNYSRWYVKIKSNQNYFVLRCWGDSSDKRESVLSR